jgi:hypothetical protein
MHRASWSHFLLLTILLGLLVIAFASTVAAQNPLPPRPTVPEVPEGDTVLLLGGGLSSMGMWLWYQWSTKKKAQ